jgi:hypothetical protein
VAAVLALTGAALFIVVGLGAAARIVYVGNLDAASISPSALGEARIELRRRQSLERVRGRLLVEDSAQPRTAVTQATPVAASVAVIALSAARMFSTEFA